jgi:hypothetical protein
MHVTAMSGTGMCADFVPPIEGRVVRLGIESTERGEFEASVLGLDLYGGHSDGFAWADAELSVSYGYGYGHTDPDDLPVEPNPDHPEEDQEWGDEEDSDESSEGRGSAPPSDRSMPYDPHTEDVDSPDAGIYVSFSADVRTSESMDGALTITVSNGWAFCEVEALIEAAYLGEEVSFDDREVIVSVVEEEVSDPVEGEDPHPEEG